MTRVCLSLIAAAVLCACSGKPSPANTAAGTTGAELQTGAGDPRQSAEQTPPKSERDPAAFVQTLDSITAQFESVASQPSAERQAELNAGISAVRKNAETFGTLLDEGPTSECVRASMLVESSWRQIESLTRNGAYPGWRNAVAEDQKQYAVARQACLNATRKAAPTA